MAHAQYIRESENHDNAGEDFKNPIDGLEYQFESDFYIHEIWALIIGDKLSPNHEGIRYVADAVRPDDILDVRLDGISQNDTLHLAQEFLGQMGSSAKPAAVAELFSENMEWDIAGDTGVLPWIGQKSGRAAVIDFINDSRAMIERVSFEVHDILASGDRAVILGSLASKLRRTRQGAETDFVIVLSVARRYGFSRSPRPLHAAQMIEASSGSLGAGQLVISQ
jgi:uncharacterized protein